MSEKIGWWTAGTTIVGGMFALCVFGFSFLNSRVDAAEKAYRAEIHDVRTETTESMKSLEDKMMTQFYKLSDKIDALRK